MSESSAKFLQLGRRFGNFELFSYRQESSSNNTFRCGGFKTQSIKNDYEYKRVYKRGQAFVNPSIVVYILRNKKNINRLGITTSKKIGHAVVRNRDRRIIRESVRQLESEMKLGYDFIFVARGRTYSLKCQNLQRIIRGILVSAKVIEKKTSAKKV